MLAPRSSLPVNSINTLHLQIALIRTIIAALRYTLIPIAKHGHKRKRHGERPQRKAHNHLRLIGNMHRANRIRNRTSNALPAPQDTSRARNIAIALCALDLRHQPIHIRLQHLVEEAEAHVDGECRVEEGAVAEVKRGRGFHAGELGLHGGVPDPGPGDGDEDEDVDEF